MPEVTIKLKQLHEAQKTVYQSQSRFTVLGCGRRFGKTDLAIDKMINAILDNPKPYFYLVPTHSDMLDVWDRFLEIARPVVLKDSVGDRRIRFVNGAMLWFFAGGDAVDRMRGKAYAGGIVDEAAIIPNLEYAWLRVIMPALSDHRGWTWFLSSFRGRNYFWQLYNKGQDSQQIEWSSFSYTTADNPYIDPSEIELARNESTEKAFQEEYLAIPNEDFGAVFRKVQDCIRVKEHIYNEPVVMGVDWGKQYDFTVLVVMGRDTKQIYEIDRFNEIDWTIQRGRLSAMARKWRPKTILVEWNSVGDPNIEELRKEGLPVQSFVTTANSKTPLIDNLVLAIETRNIGFDDSKPHVKDLINELQAYEMERLPSGNFRYQAASGAHDDMVIATALAHRAASTGRAAYAEMPEELLDWRG